MIITVTPSFNDAGERIANMYQGVLKNMLTGAIEKLSLKRLSYGEAFEEAYKMLKSL